MGFAKYTLVGTKIIKDGHIMFPEDIVRDLNRKSALEEKILQSASLNQHTQPEICASCISKCPGHTLCAKYDSWCRDEITRKQQAGA